MDTALRPMNTAEILDRTFSLYRHRFLLFAGIAMLPPALLLLAELMQTGLTFGYLGHAAASAKSSVFAVIAGSSAVLAGFVAYFIGIAIAQAATVFAVSAVHLGRETSIRECYGRVKGKYGRVFNVVFSVALRVFGSAMVCFLVAVLVPAFLLKGNTAAAIVGALVLFIAVVAGIALALLLYSRYALAVPACVLENLKARDAIKRSVALTSGRRGRILLVVFLVGVITLAVMGAFSIPAILLFLAFKNAPALTLTVQQLGRFIAGTLTGAIATIALSLIYYDERVRKEAFDIQLMMASLDEPAPAQASGAVANLG